MVAPSPSVGEEPLSTTAAGYARFLERLARARLAYDAVVATNGDAAEAGDNSVWHDNFAYEENQRQMHQLARRIHDLQDALRRLRVVTPPARPARVSLGTAVTFEDADGAVERVVLGGYEDGDPEAKRIAYTAPLGRCLLGAEPGDSRTLRIAGRTRELTVLSVDPAHEEEL